MMKLRRSSTNEEEGNQSGKRSERDQRRGGVTAEASQSLEQQPDGRLSIWRRAREAQTGMWSGSAQDICTPAAGLRRPNAQVESCSSALFSCVSGDVETPGWACWQSAHTPTLPPSCRAGLQACMPVMDG
ncbi:uncharacterized protein LOC124401350 isoform X23 [Silurus meridionalis]|uniref:uncharacterized protein LOC124401350 isoform X23 n=1 Tax=Silurus meridionalis TaxID=175797 RepID=UPI001EEA5584|nr:uncharacterized protein LOC124401350 isoform X23 [Silurus meridionalis]